MLIDYSSDSEFNQSFEEVDEDTQSDRKRIRLSDGSRPMKAQRQVVKGIVCCGMVSTQKKRRESRKRCVTNIKQVYIIVCSYLCSRCRSIYTMDVVFYVQYIWGYKWKDKKPEKKSSFLYMDLINEWNKEKKQ